MSDPDAHTTDAPACYRHPDRPALLRCSRCERPICGADAIEAPVGYQCPECAKGGTPVRRLVDLGRTADVTRVLVGILVAVFVVTNFVAPQVLVRLGLRPILLTGLGVEGFDATRPWFSPGPLATVIGEPWLLVTSAFLHVNPVHVGFNSLLLWQLGHMLEPALGPRRFVALYAAGLAGGSLGVVLVSWIRVLIGLGTGNVVATVLGGDPFQLTVGASGAVFGLMGAAMVGMHQRGVNPWRTSIGALVLLNLVLTFGLPMVSVGGHVGGLLGGALAGRLLFVERQREQRATWQAVGLAVAMLVAAVGVAHLMIA